MKKIFKGMRDVRYVALLSFAVLFSAGCAGKLPDMLKPVGAEFATMTTEEVSQAIGRRAETFRTLSGIGKVRIQNWDERYKFTQVFVFEKPSRFRLETLGFLDQPAVFFTSDEQMLSLYSKKMNAEYRGVASRENLFKLSGINLSVEDFLLVLSGNPPQIPDVTSEWGVAIQEGRYHYLERISFQKNLAQRIWYDTQYRTVSQVQEFMLTNGIMTLNVRYDDYRGEQGGYPLPAKIDIERPLDKVRVSIAFREIEVNQDIAPGMFAFTPPENATIYHIESDQELGRLDWAGEFRVQEDEGEKNGETTEDKQ